MRRPLIIICLVFFLGTLLLSGCCRTKCAPGGPYHHAMSDCPKATNCPQHRNCPNMTTTDAEKMADCPQKADCQPCPNPRCPKKQPSASQ